MAQPTTTVKADRNADFTYELDITSDAKRTDIRLGRETDIGKARPGTCTIMLDNSGGAYTAKGAGTPLRPMHGIQVIADSQKLFTGFIRRTQLHPDGNKQRVRVDCADWLWILSRTDISLPMMLNVRSDILAHRIADLAEVGELVDNPRFKTDLTGYSKIDGGETMTRKTTSPVMEGPASCYVETDASTEGVRYTIPHDADADFQGKKVTIVAYVINDGGSELSVTLVLADNTGDKAAAGVTLSSQWQRIEVAGTFDGAATDFYIDIEQVAGGTRAFRIGAVHSVDFIKAIPRSFSAGQSRFSHIAPRRTKALRAIQEAADNELGGYVYVNGAGTLVFEDRHFRWRESTSTSSQGTIDETMVDLPYEEDADDLAGEVELGYVLWEEGATDSTVFQLFPVPRAIPGNDSLTIDGDYGALVKDFTVPVANTDFYIRSQPDGDEAGDDETGNVAVTFEDFGGGFQAVFTSSVAYTTYLTGYKVRATPVRIASDQPTETYTPSGAPDYASKLKANFRWASSQPDVEAMARYWGDRYVTQRERLPVKLLNKTSSLSEMTDRVISERVTITNDNTDYSSKVNGAYYIDAIRHRLSQGKTKMETTWSVVPVDVDMFIIGSSLIDGSDVIAP